MSILAIVVEILKLLKNVNENIHFVHGYAYSSGKQKICTWINEESWGMMKTCFPDAKQIIKCQKKLYNECTYVQKDINRSNENFDFTQDNEPTFLSSYFMKNL